MQNIVEAAALKLMRTVKTAKGSVEGLAGVFKTLMAEHGEILALLMRVKASSDPEVRRRLFPRIRKELLSHEKAEILVLYPVYRRHADLARIAEQHAQEAHALEGLVERLHGMDVAGQSWGPAFQELVSLVQRHVRDEEDDHFPIASRAFGEQSAALDSQYRQSKAEAMSKIL